MFAWAMAQIGLANMNILIIYGQILTKFSGKE